MRFELSGSIARADPVTLPPLVNGVPFIPGDYISQGYTDFDVICIGGGGGAGGNLDTANTGTKLYMTGGQGGGGGYHRVQGKLSLLPSSCPVVVGASGNDGTTATTAGGTSDGTDGGPSSFNGTTCRASGGKGGKKVTNSAITSPSGANGGDGGIGNTITAGGGGAGGINGDPDLADSTDGEDGTIVGNIGHGGGGGSGGMGSYTGPTYSYLLATAGGRGSYDPTDLLVAGDGEDPQDGPVIPGNEDLKPGRGGGAKAAPLNGLPYNYGQAGSSGAVIIRLTSR